MKKDFSKLIDDLQYFSTDDNLEKTIEEIADECRQFIRESGYPCLDEGFDEEEEAKEWATENHPEWVGELEATAVLFSPMEFLCLGFNDELGFSEITITFYGDFEKGVGVFGVSTD